MFPMGDPTILLPALVALITVFWALSTYPKGDRYEEPDRA